MLYWEYCIRSDVNDCAVSQGQGTSESCDSSMFSSSQEKEAENKVINCNWIVMLYSMPSLTTMVYFEETQNRVEVPETVMLRKHENFMEDNSFRLSSYLMWTVQKPGCW